MQRADNRVRSPLDSGQMGRVDNTHFQRSQAMPTPLPSGGAYKAARHMPPPPPGRILAVTRVESSALRVTAQRGEKAALSRHEDRDQIGTGELCPGTSDQVQKRASCSSAADSSRSASRGVGRPPGVHNVADETATNPPSKAPPRSCPPSPRAGIPGRGEHGGAPRAFKSNAGLQPWPPTSVYRWWQLRSTPSDHFRSVTAIVHCHPSL